MCDPRGHVLTVRKRGTATFMLPGGKPEPGEAPADTALREFAEEVGGFLDAKMLTFWGEFRAAAANEAGVEVVAHVFEHPYVHGLRAGAEIEVLEWVDPGEPRDDMAPLNTMHIFPRLVQ